MINGRRDPKMPALCPCMQIPLVQRFREYFSISLLIKSFGTAAIFSLFLYLEWMEIKWQWLYTLLAVGGFLGLFWNDRGFWIGFFIGVLWFWWIALSFRYYGLPWMIPFVILAIGVLYAIIFWLGYRVAAFLPTSFGQTLGKGIFLWSVSYIHPFGFNWFIPQLSLVRSFFSFGTLSFAFFLMLIGLMVLVRSWKKLLILPLFLFLWHHPTPRPLAPLAIDLVTTHLPQDKKWRRSELPQILQENFLAIQRAIAKNYDAVVLPESAFPLFLNLDPVLLVRLQKLSHKIAIVTGALAYKKGKIYNSTYVFENGHYRILDKVILVPFGEEIPLPKPLARLVNHIFFGDASDYDHATAPQIYTIKGVRFTNAICYEATHPLMYQTPTPYIIAMSNNAWFWPSLEPWLQNLIMKYYATIYHKVVYHATNIAKTEVIR